LTAATGRGRRREEIIRLSKEELSLVTRDMNPDVIYRYTCFYNDRETFDVTHGLNVQQFRSVRPWQRPPSTAATQELSLRSFLSVSIGKSPTDT
jgi:hypothetical protein